jgi:hypothetical protein
MFSEAFQENGMSAHPIDQRSQRQRYWLGHLRACETAGQTLVAYAAAHDLDVKALYNAKSRLRKQELLASQPVPAALRRVQVVSAMQGWQCRVRLSHGVVVEFAAGCDRQWLSSVLAAARERL